ncbi:hypothetical protein Tcan_00556, partial [Toxocara canis]
MKAIRQYMNTRCITMLINAHITPKIRLFLPITATATRKELKTLQRVANHSIRVIHNLKKFEQIGEHKTRYNWGDISTLSSMEFKVMVKKMQNGQLSENLNNLLTKTTHNRTRHEMYTCETFRTNYGQKTIRHRATAFLNTLLHLSDM